MATMNPYLLDLPAAVAFSGGRTSGVMLRNILDAHDAAGWPRPHVVFNNTGKERLETLDFVHQIEVRWQVPIVWLEYRYDSPLSCPTRAADYLDLPVEERMVRWEHWRREMQFLRASNDADGTQTYVVVNYQTASRHGQPFDEAVGKKSFLPNRVARYCTAELKVKTMWRWARDQADLLEGYTKAVGLRADEPRRVQRILSRVGRETRASETIVCPLAEAGVRLGDVMNFWARQPFDLKLEPHEGNCDLCFLKRKGSLLSILREQPDLADWWIAQEQEGRLFRSTADRPRYSLLLLESQERQLFDGLEEEDDIACACTD